MAELSTPFVSLGRVLIQARMYERSGRKSAEGTDSASPWQIRRVWRNSFSATNSGVGDP